MGHNCKYTISQYDFHTKISKDFNKGYDKLKFPIQKQKNIKPFTHPKASSWIGEGSYNATSCKLFPIKQFSTEFQKQLLGLYNLSEKETNDEEDEQDNGEFLTLSLDYPSLHQSKKETWKV